MTTIIDQEIPLGTKQAMTRLDCSALTTNSRTIF